MLGIAHRFSWPRLSLAVAFVIIGFAVILPFLPIPPGLDGMTLCYPLIGPIQQFDQRLPDSMLALARAHEAAHADQCHRKGAFLLYLRQITARGRLKLEAEAYCAESRYEQARGQPANASRKRVLAELRIYSRFARFTDEEIARTYDAVCHGTSPPTLTFVNSLWTGGFLTISLHPEQLQGGFPEDLPAGP